MKNEEKELNQRDELVTVAIHTYEKAQILKSILEANGIPAVITSVNIIQPNPAGSYRVKIRKSDLPEALPIIENTDLSYVEKTGEEKNRSKDKEIKKEILVPTDFSDSSMRACEFAFRLAKDLGCEIKLMHVFSLLIIPYLCLLVSHTPSFLLTKSFISMLERGWKRR